MDIRVEKLPMPASVHGMCAKDEDGIYWILINSNDSEARQLEAYDHEMDHIRRGDLEREGEDGNYLEAIRHGQGGHHEGV